jgi:hypothetical protein
MPEKQPPAGNTLLVVVFPDLSPLPERFSSFDGNYSGIACPQLWGGWEDGVKPTNFYPTPSPATFFKTHYTLTLDRFSAVHKIDPMSTQYSFHEYLLKFKKGTVGFVF